MKRFKIFIFPLTILTAFILLSYVYGNKKRKMFVYSVPEDRAYSAELLHNLDALQSFCEEESISVYVLEVKNKRGLKLVQGAEDKMIPPGQTPEFIKNTCREFFK
ncbi:MAG: hypothetical protein CSB55_04660 [Candidatus Cloacimonadota bacterium]|nr:MAG: hypothetical protein CSB55_04660 [Candidatus Cloacimonadota bacterium]